MNLNKNMQELKCYLWMDLWLHLVENSAPVAFYCTLLVWVMNYNYGMRCTQMCPKKVKECGALCVHISCHGLSMTVIQIQEWLGWGGGGAISFTTEHQSDPLIPVFLSAVARMKCLMGKNSADEWCREMTLVRYDRVCMGTLLVLIRCSQWKMITTDWQSNKVILKTPTRMQSPHFVCKQHQNAR